MTFKPYNFRVKHTGKGVQHTIELRSDLVDELKKSGELLRKIRDIAVGFRSNLKWPGYQLLREHELMNERLSDIVELWGDEGEHER